MGVGELMNAALFSSACATWSTPQWLFDDLNAEFEFGLDAAASWDNKKCVRFFGDRVDALTQDWTIGGLAAWCNPPYSRQLKQWVDKAHETAAAANGVPVVMLVPARPDTKWFRRAFETASELRFIPFRLRFGNATTSAPFPSCLFIFRPGHEGVKTVRYWP